MEEEIKKEEVGVYEINRAIGTANQKFINYLRELKKEDNFSVEMRQGFNIGVLYSLFIDYLEVKTSKPLFPLFSSHYIFKEQDLKRKKDTEELFSKIIEKIPENIRNGIFKLIEEFPNIQYNEKKDNIFGDGDFGIVYGINGWNSYSIHHELVGEKDIKVNKVDINIELEINN